MKTQPLKCLFIPIIVFSCFCLSVGQERESPLRDKKITIHRVNESLGTIFRDLIEIYDVPIGFEESTFDAKHDDYLFEVNTPFEGDICATYSSDGTKSKCKQRVFNAKTLKFTVYVENESLENVLNQIVSNMRYYKWEIKDEVVNIFPTAGRNKKFEELLNLKVKNFTFKKLAASKLKTLHDLRTNIFLIPEVRSFLKDNNLTFSGSRYSSPNLGRDISDDWEFSDITLKELLNRITKIKRGGWALGMNHRLQSKTVDYIDIDI